jgi:hypothetical protein
VAQATNVPAGAQLPVVHVLHSPVQAPSQHLPSSEQIFVAQSPALLHVAPRALPMESSQFPPEQTPVPPVVVVQLCQSFFGVNPSQPAFKHWPAALQSVPPHAVPLASATHLPLSGEPGKLQVPQPVRHSISQQTLS